MTLPREAFVTAVCQLFGLANSSDCEVSSLPGAANRLWRFAWPVSSFVVKEFRYTVRDEPWARAIRRAADFEFQAWQAGVVPMPEPVRTVRAELVPQVTGSRGRPTLVRVHRWSPGERMTWPIDAAVAAQAGSQLADLQRWGARYARRDRASLWWWRWQPLDVLERLRRSGLFDDETVRAGRRLVTLAEQLVKAGEGTDDAWTFCHFDYKPDNVLRCGVSTVVLDWDAADFCQARIEAVESALRWAGIERGPTSDDLFVAFVEGYRGAGGGLTQLEPTDFAKYAASIVGWFDYLARRALHEFDDTDAEAGLAAAEARAALTALDTMFAELDRWRSLLRS